MYSRFFDISRRRSSFWHLYIYKVGIYVYLYIIFNFKVNFDFYCYCCYYYYLRRQSTLHWCLLIFVNSTQDVFVYMYIPRIFFFFSCRISSSPADFAKPPHIIHIAQYKYYIKYKYIYIYIVIPELFHIVIWSTHSRTRTITHKRALYTTLLYSIGIYILYTCPSS